MTNAAPAAAVKISQASRNPRLGPKTTWPQASTKVCPSLLSRIASFVLIRRFVRSFLYFQILWLTELETDDIDSHPIQIILTEEHSEMTDVPDKGASFTSTLKRKDTLKLPDLVNTPEKYAAMLNKNQKPKN